MFYRTQIQDHVRVPPDMFGLEIEDGVLKRLKKAYEGHISQELGIVIDVAKVLTIGEGVIVPGDGASYYEATFEIMTFKPELQEVVLGKIRDIEDFGAFLTIGPIDGMIHISQTMDDFVSFSKEKILTGKDHKRVLKVGDQCIARVIAVSYKDISNPKIGLTMRQQGLGKLDWLQEEVKEEKEKPKAAARKEKKEKKK
jgi:DNA-directed RNA polymerase subunit E'